MFARRDAIAGLMFIAVAVFGLWASRNYAVGTAFRMGTGYVPRLLCWLLLGLGTLVMVQGLRSADAGSPFAEARYWRAIVLVPVSLLAFALTMVPKSLSGLTVGMFFGGLSGAIAIFGYLVPKPAEMLSMSNVIVLTAIAFLIAGVGIALGERITRKVIVD